MSRFLIACLLFLPAPGFAQQPPENAKSSPAPDMPELPPPIQSGEEMPPDITIIRKGTDTIQEFRRNGKLYLVKVKPDVGPAYYLIDKNGDGVMDVKRSDLDKDSEINLWKLLEWD